MNVCIGLFLFSRLVLVLVVHVEVVFAVEAYNRRPKVEFSHDDPDKHNNEYDDDHDENDNEHDNQHDDDKENDDDNGTGDANDNGNFNVGDIRRE